MRRDKRRENGQECWEIWEMKDGQKNWTIKGKRNEGNEIGGKDTYYIQY